MELFQDFACFNTDSTKLFNTPFHWKKKWDTNSELSINIWLLSLFAANILILILLILYLFKTVLKHAVYIHVICIQF